MIPPRQPWVEHRRQGELLTGARQRFGLVRFAEEREHCGALKQAVHPIRPVVLLVAELDELGGVLAREQ